MRIVFRPEAKMVLDEIGDFVDGLNTEGSGAFWTEKLVAHLYSFALPNTQYALCRNEEFAALGFSCINYNDWIIAFKIESNLFTVYKIARGNILK